MSSADRPRSASSRDQRRRQRQVSAYLSELRSAHAPQRWRRRLRRAEPGGAAPGLGRSPGRTAG